MFTAALEHHQNTKKMSEKFSFLHTQSLDLDLIWLHGFF